MSGVSRGLVVALLKKDKDSDGDWLEEREFWSVNHAKCPVSAMFILMSA